MAVATRYRDWDSILKTLAAAASVGDLHQLRDGRPGYMTGLNAAGNAGDQRTFQASDQVTLPKAPNIALLDGGRAYWQRANGYVSFNTTPGGRDFYCGRIVGDALPAATQVVVNLGIDAGYDLDLAAKPFAAAPVLTAGNPTIARYGGAHLLKLDATNEAQKIDGLSDDGFATGACAIVEAIVKVIADDSSTNGVFSIGVASGTHATAFTSIADSIGVQVKNHDGKIYAESKTAGVTVAPTDTTKTYAVGTPFEIWIDMRIPAACKIYVNGVQVLTATVFDISASAVAWYLLCHLVKASSTDTFQVQVNRLTARTAEQ
jgi:hypothetical protein